jgi:hypothetical protein
LIESFPSLIAGFVSAIPLPMCMALHATEITGARPVMTGRELVSSNKKGASQRPFRSSY